MLFGRKPRKEEFEAAALPHLNDIYRTAVRVLGDPAKAEDVVQDVFVQAWKSFDRFEAGTNCRAWLYKLLFHSINQLRRKWRTLRVVGESDPMPDPAGPDDGFIPDRMRDEDILAALGRLPEDVRAVVLLADVEEFPYKEVAFILQVPVGAVMSRLSRGRALLRSALVEIVCGCGVEPEARKGRTA